MDQWICRLVPVSYLEPLLPCSQSRCSQTLENAWLQFDSGLTHLIILYVIQVDEGRNERLKTFILIVTSACGVSHIKSNSKNSFGIVRLGMSRTMMFLCFSLWTLPPCLTWKEEGLQTEAASRTLHLHGTQIIRFLFSIHVFASEELRRTQTCLSSSCLSLLLNGGPPGTCFSPHVYSYNKHYDRLFTVDLIFYS